MKHSQIALTILFCVATTYFLQGDYSDTKADNTKVNKHDRNSGEVTADQQKAVLQLTSIIKKIRQSVTVINSLLRITLQHQDHYYCRTELY